MGDVPLTRIASRAHLLHRAKHPFRVIGSAQKRHWELSTFLLCLRRSERPRIVLLKCNHRQFIVPGS
jgi:hypothetical protein